MKAASVTSATKPVTPGVSQASYESAPASLPAVRPVVKHQVPASSLSTVQPIFQLPQLPATSLSAAATSLPAARPMVQQQQQLIPATSLSTVQPLTRQQQQIPATLLLTVRPVMPQQMPATLATVQPISQQQQIPAILIYLPPALTKATLTASPIASAPMLSVQPYQQLPQTSTVRSASYNHLPIATSQNGLVQYVSGVSLAPISSHVISSSPSTEFAKVVISALVSGARHVEALARQQQMQQYFYAADKPLDAGSPFMTTPPDSSLIRRQTAEQIARAPALYNLAYMLCDSPLHIQSACPSCRDLGVLTRCRVAIESNLMLAPGIRETNLCVIDQFIQAVFTNR